MTIDLITDILSNGNHAAAVANCLRGNNDARIDCHVRDDASELQQEGMAEDFLSAFDAEQA